MHSEFGKLEVGENSHIQYEDSDPSILKRIHITVGDNCKVILRSIVYCNSNVSIIMGNNASIEFGSRQKFNGDCSFQLIEPSQMMIGSDCLWAFGLVTTSDFHSVVERLSSRRINHAKDISIGDRVWFGRDFLVLKGATIGNDSVVAAKAVVTGGNYESHCIIAGNPAKVVKRDISWDAKLLP